MLTEWYAFSLLSPIGDEREDFRMGQIAAAVTNTRRSKGQRPARASDFIPEFGKTTIKQSESEFIENARAVFMSASGVNG